MKDTWAYHFSQKAHENAKGPIQILIFLHVNEWEMGLWPNFRAGQYSSQIYSCMGNVFDSNYGDSIICSH